jgi:hypothetical protein
MNVGDRLLYAVSARGEMPWAAVKRAFDCLYEPFKDESDTGLLRYRRSETVRMLESLAHVEFDARPQRMRVTVTQPAIAILPGRGLPSGVLTGARSEAKIGRLAAAAMRSGVFLDVQCQTFDPRFNPSRISLVADNLDQLTVFAQAEGLHWTGTPAAWSILNVAGSLDDYSRTLVPGQMSSLNWEREDFNPEALCFTRLQRQDSTLLSRYTHPTRRTLLHVLYKDGVGSIVDPDWGRFAVMHAAGRGVLAYDAQLFEFFVPVTIPLPKLLARALCLCSGLVPAVTNGITWPGAHMSTSRVYHRVPLSVAKLIAEKLGQRLEFRHFGNDLLRRTRRG